MRLTQLVHELYGPGGEAVEPVGKLFPGVVVDGAVSRPELAKHVINQEVCTNAGAMQSTLLQQWMRACVCSTNHRTASS